MKEISFSSLHFRKMGQPELCVVSVVCRVHFRASICSGKGRWVPLAPEAVRPVRAELTAGFSAYK